MATVGKMKEKDQKKSAYYDILLLGPTGMGKSTTGNKLLLHGTAAYGVAHRLEQWEEGEEGAICSRDLSFKTGKGVDSVTQECKVISREVSKIRVLDTPGFADSRDTKKYGVFRGNIKTFRSVLHAQNENDLAFNRVLYFIPQRCALERADGTLQEELQLIHGYFSDEVFEIMVLVATTVHKENKPQIEFDDEDIESTERAFMAALGSITKNIDKCPPIVFLRFDESDVISKIVRAPVLYEERLMKPEVIEASIDHKTTQQLIDDARQRNEGTKLMFQDGRCAKCSAKIIYLECPMRKFPDRVIVNEGGENEENIAYDVSKCHPIVIPRHSTITKVVGGICHIATGGAFLLATSILGRKFWPGFTNEDEICDSCKQEPSAEPCLQVNTTYHYKTDRQELSIITGHSTKIDVVHADTP